MATLRNLTNDTLDTPHGRVEPDGVLEVPGEVDTDQSPEDGALIGDRVWGAALWEVVFPKATDAKRADRKVHNSSDEAGE